MGLDELVKQVWPDFPDDRKVVGTSDRVVWYKINQAQRQLLVPTFHLLRLMTHEIDRFTEAVQSYAVSDLDALEYEWDNLVTHHASTRAEALDCIATVKAQSIGNSLACDIETRRVDWMDNKLLAVGFATAWDTAYAISYFDEEVFAALQNLFNQPGISFIWQNGKFDCTRLKWLVDIDARVDEDIMLLHYARINPRKGTHGLKQLGQLYLQAPAWEDELDMIKKRWCAENKTKLDEFMYDMLPLDVLIPYLHKDVIATYRLYPKLLQIAKPSTELIYRKLIEGSAAYKRVELTGIPIDFGYLEDLEYDLEKALGKANKVLNDVADREWNPRKYMIETGAKSAPQSFNIKSPKQLKWMLETTLGVKLDNTNKETIKGLVAEFGMPAEEEDDQDPGIPVSGITRNEESQANTEVLQAIQSVRKLNKQMDTYVQGIRNKICDDFRLRGTYNLHGTETGRLSSSDPNMQNIPQDPTIKNLFVSSPGYKLLQLDYSQVELRVLALLSQDPFLMSVYAEGKDLHSSVAEQMFGPDFTKKQRDYAKTINFGIAYGRGPSSIAAAFKISMHEAINLIKDWYGPMPKVKEYIQNRRGMAVRGEPCITLFGRERNFIVTSENLHHVQNEYINTPIQSVASDLTLFSLIELDNWILETGIDARIIASVHDSILLEVADDKETIETVAREGKRIMADIPQWVIDDCNVPFVADVEIGYKWGELEKYNPCK